MPNEQIPEEVIQAEHVRTTFRQVPVAIVSHVVDGAVLVALLWLLTDTPRRALGGWLATLLALGVVRALVMRLYQQRRPSDAAWRRWALVAAAFSGAFGLLWAVAILAFMDFGNLASVVLLVVIPVGLASGASATSAAVPRVAFAFLYTVLPALVWALFSSGAALGYAIGSLVLLALATDTAICLNVHRVLDNALRLRFENDLLRRRAEEQTELLQTTLQSISQGIAAQAPEGRLRMWNQRFLSLLGMDALPAAPTLAAAFAGATPPVTPPTRLPADRRFDYRRGDGGTVEVWQGTTPDGGSVWTLTDITGTREREQALEEARTQAERANQAKTRFLAAASHDLRQPMHALGLFFSALAERVQDPHDRQLTARIDETLGVVNGMLNALLDISKLDAGVLEPTPAPVPVGELFQRLATELAPLAAEHANRLRFRPCAAWVHTDPAMLERILRNLVVNALRCTQGGRVLVTGRRRGGRLRLAVRDTGPGIPAARLDEIFLEFRQLDNPQRDRNRGLGLGLAIVRRLSTLLDHPLEVRSTVGRGSCFALSVPLCAPAPSATAAGNGTRAPAGEACRHCVLVLDDDRMVREAMQTLLLGWGYRACIAACAEEALQRAADCPPDLLLVDYRLPDGVTGADAVEAIRAACGRAMPAVVITGDTAPDRLREAVEHGYPLLHKPVQPAKLRSTLRYLTDRDAAHPDANGR